MEDLLGLAVLISDFIEDLVELAFISVFKVEEETQFVELKFSQLLQNINLPFFILLYCLQTRFK